MQQLTVTQIGKRRERALFLDVPHLVYQDDPVWVPPLRLEEAMRLSPKSPLQEHAEVATSACSCRGLLGDNRIASSRRKGGTQTGSS